MRRIEKREESLHKSDTKQTKVLLLGAGECGKSTILKQMKLLHLNGFTPEEKLDYKELIYSNVLESIQSLCQAMKDLDNTAYGEPENEVRGKLILAHTDDYQPVLSDAEIFDAVWNDSGIKKVYDRRREFNCLDSCSYFLKIENMVRILAPDYEPTNDDILRCRLATTGIRHIKFTYSDHNFHVFDVGGQRGERKKWIHFFESVSVILYIASLVEYDQVLAEDRDRNRMEESLAVFEGIINLSWFEHASIILFLNKRDLFEEKIATVALSQYFPEYIGNNDNLPKEKHNREFDYDQGVAFIEGLYKAKNYDPEEGREKRSLYTHITEATNAQNIDKVWKIVRHRILEDSLTNSGLTYN